MSAGEQFYEAAKGCLGLAIALGLIAFGLSALLDELVMAAL